MYKALKRREKEREKAIQLATEYVGRLERDIGALTGVLYGSFARGDFNLGSDIDVLIISDSLPLGALERMDLLYRYVQGRIEPKGYTQAEFLMMFHSNNPLAMDALENGEILSDDGFWRKIILATEFHRRTQKRLCEILCPSVANKNSCKEGDNILQERTLKPKRPRIGHIWVRFRPRIGHIKPRDLAGAIREETPGGSKVKIKVDSTGGRSLRTVALVNTGFETLNPQLLLPIKAAEELSLWPNLPTEAKIEIYDTAGGPMRVYIVPNAAWVSVLAEEQESRSILSDIVISHTEIEVLISDKLAGQLKVSIEDPADGVWRFRDDSPGKTRKSESPKYWA